MKKSSLIDMLRSFSLKEIREFDDYIRSPFFNKSESVVKLYDYLRKYYPDFPENKMEKREIYRKIFSGTAYNDGFTRKVIFQLSRLGEEYISYIANFKDPVRSQFNFLNELLSRNLPKSYRKHFPEIVGENEAKEHHDSEYSQNKFLIESLIVNSMDKLRYKIDLHDKKVSYNEHVIEKLRWLRDYFLKSSLNTYRFLNYQGYIDQFEFTDDVLDVLIKYLVESEKVTQNKAEPESSVTRLHIYEILLMQNKSVFKSLAEDKYYHTLKHLLAKEQKHYSHDMMFSLSNILHEHCSYKILRGFSEYKAERFELDKIALEHKIYRSESENFFPPPAFASFVRDASEINETEWAQSFIENNQGLLEPVNYETVLNLANAQIFFSKGEYQSALQHLNKIKPIKRLEFKFGVKELTSMIFYELSMFSEAYYLMDTFRHFIANMGKHFSEERIVSRNSYIKYYIKLMKLKENKKLKGVDEIKMDLKNNSLIIFNRDWLAEKVKELGRK